MFAYACSSVNQQHEERGRNELPKLLPAHQLAVSRLPAGLGVSKRPILVVDDDPSIIAMVAETLRLEGCEVKTAANGAEALEAIEREEPALVVLDMRMPVLHGWGFARELRSRGARVPILVMTAAQNAQRWAEEAEGYVAKPFELNELLASVGAPPRDRASELS